MKNKRSFLAGMLTMLMIFALVGTASATVAKVTKDVTYNNISVTLDGKKLDLRDAKGKSVEPFLSEGTNYLPVRAVAEALGLDVDWDGASSTVILTTPGTTQPDVQPQPDPEPQPQPQPDNTKKTVYVTKTGKKYHYSNTCNGGTYYASTLADALNRGLTACSKCVH